MDREMDELTPNYSPGALEFTELSTPCMRLPTNKICTVNGPPKSTRIAIV